MASKKPAPVVKLVSVRFLRYDAPFKEGEVHSFSPAAAEKLIGYGVAEKVEDAG